MISGYLPPKTLWGFTKAKPPRLPGRRRCPGWVLLECTVIPGKKRVWRQGPSPARPGVWMQARAAVPNLSTCSDDFWLPNWSTVPSLLLQAVYPWLERSAVRLIWGLFGSNPASSAPWPYNPTQDKCKRLEVLSSGGKGRMGQTMWSLQITKHPVQKQQWNKLFSAIQQSPMC